MKKYNQSLFFLIISLFIIFSSCKQEEVLRLEGTLWTASWDEIYVENGNEFSNSVYATLTFGDKNCFLEIPQDDYIDVFPYTYNNKFLVISVSNHLERINFSSNYNFVWRNCPFVQGQFQQDVTFRKR